ncbi:GTP pyrophosphokinase [Cutibacterium acnes JCM 18920]|nr:GTP pyrophosphokinase [Cutibacterium acnes JCM 18920]
MTDDSVYGPYGSGKGTLGKPKPGQQRSQPRMRMRERIVRWGTPKPPAPTQSVTDPLISVVLANHPKADTASSSGHIALLSITTADSLVSLVIPTSHIHSR